MNKQRHQELQESIRKMQAVSDQFYAGAIHAENHAFIEFCGLMNEYIGICQQTLNNGVDFTQCNVHCGGSDGLVMHSFQRDYLQEKLSCIFEGTGLEFSDRAVVGANGEGAE